MTSPTPDLLTAREVAQQLRTSPWRITEECKQGRMRAFKPGKAWLIPADAVTEYLERHANTPAAPAAPTRRRRRKAS